MAKRAGWRAGVLGLMLGMAAAAWCQDGPRMLFYAAFDGQTRAFTSTGPTSAVVAASDVLLTGLFGERFAEGVVGQGFLADSGGLAYPTQDAFVPERGTVSLWIRPAYDGTAEDVYSTMFGAANWGLLYKYTTQTFITFGVIKDDGQYDYGCTASIAHWKKGEWHHVAATWDKPGGSRAIYLDGRRAAEGKIPSYRPCDTRMVIGANPGNAYPATGVLDEVWIWDRPLDDDEIAAAYERTRQGEPSWEPPAESLRVPGAPQPPSGDAPPLPEGVDWAIYEPGVVRTATRVRLPLSGYWRFQAMRNPDGGVTREEMGLLRVPGTWATQAGDWATVYGPDLRPRPRLADGTPVRTCVYGWYEREFEAPRELAGKRVLLSLDSVRAIAEVWLNGEQVGRALEYEGACFDVTEDVRVGERNTVAVLVTSLKIDGDAKGLDQDVWLEGVPMGMRLGRVGLVPSASRGKLGVRAELEGGGPVEGLRLVADCTGSGGTAKRLTMPLRAAAAAPGSVAAGATLAVGETAWADAHPWSPDDPFLYTGRVALEDAAGKLLDELPPFRFGFRDFEIRGGDLYLNGKKTHLHGQASPPFSYAAYNTDPEFIRQWFADLRRAGGNTVRDYSYGLQTGERFWAKDNVFGAADEMGVMFLAHLPDLRNVLPGWAREAVREGYGRRIASYVWRYWNHPCVIMWQQDFNLAAYTGDIAPFMLDTDYFPAEASYAERKRTAGEAEAMLRDLDPSRPVLHHASGTLGSMYTTMTYLGFGIPLQEREEWPLLWSRRKQKPLMIMETGFPCILSYYKTRAWGKTLAEVYGSEPLVAEYTAMYLGERAYELEGDAAMEYYDPANYNRRTDQLRLGPAYQAQKELWATSCLRSWRTYDLSGIFLHVEIREGYRQEPEQVGDRPLDARAPYMYVEKLPAEVLRPWETFPMLAALQRANWPVIGYIGGPGDRWVTKDHAFYAGETVRKSAVFISDRQSPVRVRGRWWAETRGSAEPLAEGRLDLTVQPGETVFAEIAFGAPRVSQRATGRIVLRARASDDTRIEDEFAFETFPRARRIAAGPACVLVPGDGTAARLLAVAGVDFSVWDGRGPVPEAKLLVIGRRAGVWSRKIEDAVRRGMRVLCFEQEREALGRLRLDDAWARHCFVSAPEHPLLAGLDDRDFASWRGDSSLTEAYPNPGLGDPPKWPEEFWHWGNTNCVTTYPIEKPQRPGFTPLLSCEFDLLYSPLVEWRLGEGRVLFCQLDVSDRYGVDPVATLLVERMLDLYGPEAQAALASSVAVVGAEAPAMAQALGIEARTFQAPPPAEELTRITNAGGVALLLHDVDPQAAYGWGAALEAARLAKTDLSAADRAAVPGLSDSDLFWKRFVDLRVLAAGQEGLMAPRTGVFGVLARGEGKVLILRFDPLAFEDPRQRTKGLRVVSLLLGAAGVRARVSLVEDAAPGPYAEDALDFNPHLYRRW